jgi:hypothetical protein
VGGTEVNKQQRTILRTKWSVGEGLVLGTDRHEPLRDLMGCFCVVTCISGAQALSVNHIRHTRVKACSGPDNGVEHDNIK